MLRLAKYFLVALICLVAGWLLLVMLVAPSAQANRVKCASNERQIYTAIRAYVHDDSQSRYPNSLATLIVTEHLLPAMFICPSTSDSPAPGATSAEQARHLMDGNHESYVYLGSGLSGDVPDDTVVLSEPMSNHPGAGGNILLASGDVKFVSSKDLETLLAKAKSGAGPITWEEGK